jgi:hypothetical protein
MKLLVQKSLKTKLRLKSYKVLKLMMNKLESRTIATRLASQRKDKPLHHKRRENKEGPKTHSMLVGSRDILAKIV